LPLPIIGILEEDRISSSIASRVDARLVYPVSLRELREQLHVWMSGSENNKKTREGDFYHEMMKILWRRGDQILLPDGQSVRLSALEWQVLHCLCDHAGETVSAETLQQILGSHQSNMANVYVCHLRRKLETVADKRIILTVRGKGFLTQYRLEES